MSSFKINVFYLILLSIIVVIHSLVELPTAEDNKIAATESIIRNTVNRLFSMLNLKGVKHKPRLKRFATIHNYFVTLTLKDHDNLNEIYRLSREKHAYNTSLITATALNELSTGNNSVELNDDITEHVDTFLSNLRTMKERFNVYSPSQDTTINEEILKILESQNGFNVTNDAEGENILDDIEFWHDSAEDGRRVYRGQNTKIKYFPFMASVQFFNKFQCGGSIIKSDLVITAASCLQLAYNNRLYRENPAFLSVRVGSNFYEGGGEDISVLEIYFHPTYDPRTLRNNLALMRLRRSLNLKRKRKRIRKIDFDRQTSSLPVTTDGITIVGWGAKRTSNILDDPWYNRLSFAVLDFYPFRECQEIYSKEYVTRTNFCAGFLSKGGGACNRDVGGPGIVGGLLTGVVSFGSPVCGAPDAPTVFTKVGYYADWIDEIMEMEAPQTDRRTTRKPKPQPPTLAPYYNQKPTTFKMEPLAGKLKPKPINPSALRIFDESDLFTKFLATMFASNEIKEYMDLKDAARQEVEHTNAVLEEKEEVDVTTRTLAPTTEVTIIDRPVTKLDIYDVSQEKAIEETKRYTVLDDNAQALASSAEEDVEKDMLKLFDNIDLNKLLDDDGKDQIPEKSINFNNVKKDDDSIITLLYVTDNEKNKANVEYVSSGSQSNEGDGMSIPTNTFLDMTYRNNATGNNYFDLISQNDLFSLLSEAINSEFKDDVNNTSIS